MVSYVTSKKSATVKTSNVIDMDVRTHLEKLVRDEEWVERFMTKVEENPGPLATPCWEWQGGLDRAGYGRIHVKKHCEKPTGRNFFAHRICYMIHRGYIEPEEYILHQCHNRLCCNPEHHQLGDHDENMQDLADSRRVAGENNHNSKLDSEQVWEILELYYAGDADNVLWSIAEIAEEFEIGRGTVSDILYGRSWKDVYDEFWGDEDDK